MIDVNVTGEWIKITDDDCDTTTGMKIQHMVDEDFAAIEIDEHVRDFRITCDGGVLSNLKLAEERFESDETGDPLNFEQFRQVLEEIVKEHYGMCPIKLELLLQRNYHENNNSVSDIVVSIDDLKDSIISIARQGGFKG